MYIERMGTRQAKNFRQLFSKASPDGNLIPFSCCMHPNPYILFLFTAVDLLQRMLFMDPDRRVIAEGALGREYLRPFADPDDEPTAPPFVDPLEQSELTTDEWKGFKRQSHFLKCIL